MTDAKPNETTAALATAADADYEAAHGLSFVAINALVMQRYMHEFGWKHEDFALSPSSLIQRQSNPFADFNSPLPQKIIRNLAWLLSLSTCSMLSIGDGAAALYLVPVESLPRNGSKRPKVTIVGSARPRIASQRTIARIHSGWRLEISAKSFIRMPGSRHPRWTSSNFTMHSPSCLRYRWKPVDLLNESRPSLSPGRRDCP
jgi:hypothetical protein